MEASDHKAASELHLPLLEASEAVHRCAERLRDHQPSHGGREVALFDASHALPITNHRNVPKYSKTFLIGVVLLEYVQAARARAHMPVPTANAAGIHLDTTFGHELSDML